ncbi:MAG: SDR family NAD(P)-dependent oxidoreductase, partial [Coprococcus sp.]
MGLLDQKVVVVTGASSGIGEKTAEVLASEGAKVVLAARRAEKLKAVEQRIIENGGEAFSVSADVSVREDCDRVVEETIAKYGRIDVLVNNAGI